MPPLIDAVSISRSFPGQPGAPPVRALRAVSLRVATGELVFLAGGAGAGKSTLLRCLAGLLRPDSGTIVRATREILYVATGRIPYGFLSVSEALELYSGDDRSALEAMSAVESLGIPHPGRTLVARLSPSQCAALSIALAISRPAKLLLIDGVLDELDLPATGRAGASLLTIARREAAVVVATRSARAIARSEDRIVGLHRGRVVTPVMTDRPLVVRRVSERIREGRGGPPAARREPAARPRGLEGEGPARGRAPIA